MRFAFVVMIHNLQAEVSVAFHERGAYVGELVRPATAVRAEHDVHPLVVLQPIELLQPIGSKPTSFPSRLRRSRRRLLNDRIVPRRLFRSGPPPHRVGAVVDGLRRFGELALRKIPV